MSQDLNALLELKNAEYEDLSIKYNDMKDLSQQIEKELETEVEHLTKEKTKLVQENQKAQQQLQEIKKKYSNETNFLEKKIDRLNSETEKIKEEVRIRSKQVVQSEIDLENLESQVRESQTVISDLEYKIDQTLERLAMAQSQFEISNTQNEEEIQRLKDQIQESQSEALAYRVREQTNGARDNQLNVSNIFEQSRRAFSEAMSTHYEAYELGNDPLPQKKRKLEYGRKVYENSIYGTTEPADLYEDEINFRSKKQSSFRSCRKADDETEANQSFSQSLFLMNGAIKKGAKNLRKDSKSLRKKYGKIEEDAGSQEKDLYSFLAVNYTNFTLTSLI